MFKRLAAAAAVVLMCSLAIARGVAPTDKKIARIMLDGTTLDAVYPAAVLALVEMGYRPICGDKVSGYIDVVVIQNQNGTDKNIPDGSVEGATLVFIEKPGGVLVVGRWRCTGGVAKLGTFFDDFFARLQESLK